MTDEEFKELEEKYKKEEIRRKMRAGKIINIDMLEKCKQDNPSIRVRNKVICLTEEEKIKVCDYIISILKEATDQ